MFRGTVALTFRINQRRGPLDHEDEDNIICRNFSNLPELLDPKYEGIMILRKASK
jgi:hypothetical protein